VSAERAGHYINILYALLLLRRGHELEPRHEDLYARVLGPQRLAGGSYEPESFAHDLEQLIDWAAVARITEPQRLRGYKDNRRVQYRYRITDDAVALLEWLEARLAARLEGRVRDSRDRLADVIGLLKEEKRVLDAWRKGQADADTARRACYLLEAVDDAIGDISAELLEFRAAMARFAQESYDIDSLRAILGWLERYVQVYIGRVHELRLEIRDRLAVLRARRYAAALAECRAACERELAATPRQLRAGGAPRPAAELIAAAELFFRTGGRLEELSRHIDHSARAVLVKMHRHIRELERRSARLDDLRATVAAVAVRPDDDDPRYAAYACHLVASAHGRFDTRSGTAGHRVAPPAPRKHELAADRRAAARPLADKQASAGEVRSLRAKKLAELGEWLRSRVLGTGDAVALSRAGLADPADPRRWLDVARARHLGGGRALRTVGAAIYDRDGRARIGTDDVGLDAPDCTIERKDRP
jgi:hypothetical protein